MGQTEAEGRDQDLYEAASPASLRWIQQKGVEEKLLKNVCAITPRGRRELRRLLREAWGRPPHSLPAGVNTALSFIDELPRQEVREAIAETIAALEQDLEACTSDEEREAQYTVMTEAIRASFVNGRDHINADLRLLRRLRELLSRAE